MDLLEGAAARAGLLCAGCASGLADHAPLGDEDDVPVAELLLELARESAEEREMHSGSGKAVVGGVARVRGGERSV